jgi:hypothetical protein
VTWEDHALGVVVERNWVNICAPPATCSPQQHWMPTCNTHAHQIHARLQHQNHDGRRDVSRDTRLAQERTPLTISQCDCGDGESLAGGNVTKPWRLHRERDTGCFYRLSSDVKAKECTGGQRLQNHRFRARRRRAVCLQSGMSLCHSKSLKRR